MDATREPRTPTLGVAAEKLRHTDENMQLAALGEILSAKAGGQMLYDLAGCLNDSSERVRRAVIAVLGETGPIAILALKNGLDETQPCVIRVLASSMLARWGEAALPAASRLIGCLTAEDETLRQVAALTLGKIGGAVVPLLRKALADSSSGARIAAARALGHAGAAAAEALNDLAQITKSEAAFPLRLACAAAALKISENSQDERSFVLQALADGDEPTRLDVLEQLGECRSNAEKATPAVLECLSEKSPQVRANAALALARICRSAPRVVSALMTLLADSETTVRLNAVTALSAFGPGASEAIPALQALQQDANGGVAAAATTSLRCIKIH
jgi:HEAT repeat protein